MSHEGATYSSRCLTSSHMRVTSKHQLKERIMAGTDDVNRHPVIHTWSYKLAETA